jgi:hypothetical protein
VAPGPTLDLLAMSGTHTRPVRLDGVHVPDARVGAILDRTAWLAHDATRTADANPAGFGVARGAIAELHVIAEQRGDEDVAGLAQALALECRTLRARAYAPVGVPVPVRLATRAESLDLAARAAMAAVTARAGAAMQRGCPAERRLREATFLQVQAQTASTRQASLALMRARALGRSDIQ